MMDAKMEIAPEAIVTKVTKHPIVEVAEGVQVRRFTVYAQMYVPAHKYSTDLVKLLPMRLLTWMASRRLHALRGSKREPGLIVPLSS
jgi:hypothetical protein